MASRFASVSEEQLSLINEAAFPKNTKVTTKFGRYLVLLTFLMCAKEHRTARFTLFPNKYMKDRIVELRRKI